MFYRNGRQMHIHELIPFGDAYQGIIFETRVTNITKTRPCKILQFFTAVKPIIFRRKNCDVFLIFAQNINCGYTLELPH